MSILDETSGKIALSDTVSVWGNMPRKRLRESLEACAGTPCFADDEQRASMLLTGTLVIGGCRAACLCSLSVGRLRAVEFQLLSGTAAEQRKQLFGLIGKPDPCPDTMHSVRVRYPFGTAWIATDPRGGGAALRITYAVKE